MRLFGYPYNDLVICKDSPDYLGLGLVLGLCLGLDVGLGLGLVLGLCLGLDVGLGLGLNIFLIHN